MVNHKRIKIQSNGLPDISITEFTPENRKIGLLNLENHYYGELMKRIGEEAELDHLGESERWDRMIHDMDEVHPGLQSHLETIITKSWTNDPWQRGGFVVYHVGQQTGMTMCVDAKDQYGLPESMRPRGRDGCRVQSHPESQRRKRLARNWPNAQLFTFVDPP